MNYRLKSVKQLVRTVFSISLLIMLSGCADLAENPISGITADEHFTNVAGFEDAVLGVYQPLRYYWGNQAGDMLGNLGTDLYRDGRLTQSWYNTYSSGLNPTSPYIQSLWNEFYRGINNANTVINRAENIEMAESLRQTRVAEARFLRAHYYYILVIHFGDVHLTLDETIGTETEANRTPEQEIWQQIIDDLEFAEQILPETQSDWGRVTRNAARHHLALVHLWQENWSQAADYAISVIESGQHSLLDNFADVFDINNQINNEIIWSVQYTQDQTANSPGNWQHLGHTMRYDQVSGMHRNLQDGRPFSRLMPTDHLMTDIFGNDFRENGAHGDRINIQNDTRYYSSFREVYHYTDAGSIPYPDASVGDTSIYVTTDPYVNYEWTEDEINEKTYMVLRIEDWVTQWYPAGEKFRDPARAAFNDASGTRDVFVMRLAETYLLAAEALYMNGQTAEAVDYFNKVRLRAEASGKNIPLITATELNLDEILDERARELAGEIHRWPTLKRTGTLLERVRNFNTRLGDTGSTASENIQEHHLLRPIPQTQIDRTTNEYSQNPGY